MSEKRHKVKHCELPKYNSEKQSHLPPPWFFPSQNRLSMAFDVKRMTNTQIRWHEPC